MSKRTTHLDKMIEQAKLDPETNAPVIGRAFPSVEQLHARIATLERTVEVAVRIMRECDDFLVDVTDAFGTADLLGDIRAFLATHAKSAEKGGWE